MNGIAFVFPGQDSQHPGMGKALADAFPESREVFRRADEALGVPLSRTCFEGSEAELAMTETSLLRSMDGNMAGTLIDRSSIVMFSVTGDPVASTVIPIDGGTSL